MLVAEIVCDGVYIAWNRRKPEPPFLKHSSITILCAKNPLYPKYS
jgi:hypothetical protein